jgi:hypothetical protein
MLYGLRLFTFSDSSTDFDQKNDSLNNKYKGPSLNPLINLLSMNCELNFKP